MLEVSVHRKVVIQDGDSTMETMSLKFLINLVKT